MKKLVAFHTVLFLTAACIFAQEKDTVKTSIYTVPALTISAGDTVSRTAPVVEEEEEEIKEPLKVIPWRESTSIGSSVVTNDSLLRWQVWPHWGEYQAYRRDVISFRQGTALRDDAYHINGYQPYEQQVEMEGISLNNPITGYVNYNLVPNSKINEVREEFNGSYRSEINLQDYYITRPVSYLNYDESEYNYRNLEFMVTRNFTDQTNLELSYWDRRDGDFYPNNNVEGSQVVGRLYHHLSERFRARTFYLRNQSNNNEPFGYNVPDPVTFAYDRYASTPFSSNGFSETTRWDWVSGIYHRQNNNSAEDGGIEAIISRNKKELTFIEDTLSWNLTSVGAKIFKNLHFHNLEVQAEVEGKRHTTGEGSVIATNNWGTWNAELDAGYNIGDRILLFGKGKVNGRSDNKQGFDVGAGVKMNVIRRLNITFNATGFSRIPTMQEMYWQSNNYTGNAFLENETGVSYSGSLDLRLFGGLSIGASGRFKNAQNTTFLAADSSFINSDEYNQVSGTVYGKFDSSLLEIESSVTAQYFQYSDINSQAAALNNQDQIIWFRNSAFIKGYVFDRAAYLKLGVKTLLSPLYYASRTFNTELNYWQGNSIYENNPSFFRLDSELSARVRGIMVVIRWENSLDGFGQAGYFEAAGYPMPPRRLIVGIRAQFRN